MKHPTSDAIAEVINVFKKVLPMATEHHLDMTDGRVNTDNHQCGTVHCHGGWFAVGACDAILLLDFLDGAKELARMLGFRGKYDLVLWAKDNPKRWGNPYGAEMFCDSIAFYHRTKRPYGAKTLQHIIDHWEEVRKRTIEAEKKEVAQ